MYRYTSESSPQRALPHGTRKADWIFEISRIINKEAFYSMHILILPILHQARPKYVWAKGSDPHSSVKLNAILPFPQIQKFKEPFPTPFKHQIQEIIERSKMTTLGGWKFGKNETNYPL
jgi:hypothetical protein